MLAALAFWGWRWGGGGLTGGVLAVLFPVLAAAIWGVFAVPGDPSRGGRAPRPVPGVVRLTLEWALFGLAAYGLWSSDARAAAETLLTATAIHYALDWERIRWLIRH
jgi:hypothetical protein